MGSQFQAFNKRSPLSGEGVCQMRASDRRSPSASVARPLSRIRQSRKRLRAWWRRCLIAEPVRVYRSLAPVREHCLRIVDTAQDVAVLYTDGIIQPRYMLYAPEIQPNR